MNLPWSGKGQVDQSSQVTIVRLEKPINDAIEFFLVLESEEPV
jgi:hypothetical protein